MWAVKHSGPVFGPPCTCSCAYVPIHALLVQDCNFASNIIATLGLHVFLSIPNATAVTGLFKCLPDVCRADTDRSPSWIQNSTPMRRRTADDITSFDNALIETETGICTSLKSDFYFRFHPPLSKKSAFLNIITFCADMS